MDALTGKGGKRPMDTLLAHLTGDLPLLARAELNALLAVVQGEPAHEVSPGFLRARLPRGTAEEVARRIGLARNLGMEVTRAPRHEALDTSPIKVEGTFAVRATLLEGAPAGLSASKVEREVGARIRGGRVDLHEPQHVFRVFVGADAALAHEVYDRENDDFEERAVKHRPYFQPVSVHPKFARALVNLTRVHDGQPLLDPFCGTGGILIEAGLCGARPVGIDVEDEAVHGALQNLEHFGVLGAEVLKGRAADVKELLGHQVPAIATDPPYGRSSTTLKVGARQVLEESARSLVDALSPGGRLAIIVPDPEMLRPFEGYLKREVEAVQRVHASLTRHYVVFSKPA